MTGLEGFSPNLLAKHAFALLMLLARIGPALLLLPGLGETSIPSFVKAGIALTLAILLLPIIDMPPPVEGIGLASVIASEMANGIWFGWLTRVLAGSLGMAGQLAADFAGLSNVLLPSAESGAQTTLLARLYEVAVPALILSSGLYRELLSVFVDFYRLIPAGGGTWAADQALVTVETVATSFGLALRLSAPFIAAAVAWNIGAGLLARLVPRLQVFFVVLPGQIGLALVVLAAIAIPLIAVWMEAVTTALIALTHRD